MWSHSRILYDKVHDVIAFSFSMIHSLYASFICPSHSLWWSARCDRILYDTALSLYDNDNENIMRMCSVIICYHETVRNVIAFSMILCYHSMIMIMRICYHDNVLCDNMLSWDCAQCDRIHNNMLSWDCAQCDRILYDTVLSLYHKVI